MTLPDFLGHAGYISIIAGLILLARQNKWGWVFRFVGDMLWFLIGFLIDMSSLWFWGGIFLMIDLWGWYKWTHKAP